jgi:glycerate dehydrogenase
MDTIIVTDGYCMNPGDLDWGPFHQLGHLHLHDRTPVDEVAVSCADATVIITNKTPIDAATIAGAKHLKLIVVAATGYNIVDVAAARSHGIPVCNIPEYSTWSVAQHAFALILELTNRVGLHASSVRAGDWVQSPDWSYARTPLMELKDKTLGIVGMGRIGRRTAEIGKAFGMRVIHHGGRAEPTFSTELDLTALAAESDIISLHCPLKPNNKAFVNRAFLSVMRSTSCLINTSRGALVNEHDLAEALRGGVIAGAALDVLSQEPPLADNPLLDLSNCIITPHHAWASREARVRLMRSVYEHVAAGLSGQPLDVVNP